MSPRPQWTFFGVPVVEMAGTRVVDVNLFTETDASQLGRYLADLGRLTFGDVSDSAFQARWHGVTIGGTAVESRPEFAIEAVRQAGPPPGAERYRRSVRRDP